MDLYVSSYLNFLAAVEVIRNNMAVRQQNDLRLYLDVIPDPTKVMLIAFCQLKLVLLTSNPS